MFLIFYDWFKRYGHVKVGSYIMLNLHIDKYSSFVLFWPWLMCVSVSVVELAGGGFCYQRGYSVLSDGNWLFQKLWPGLYWWYWGLASVLLIIWSHNIFFWKWPLPFSKVNVSIWQSFCTIWAICHSPADRWHLMTAGFKSFIPVIWLSKCFTLFSEAVLNVVRKVDGKHSLQLDMLKQFKISVSFSKLFQLQIIICLSIWSIWNFQQTRCSRGCSTNNSVIHSLIESPNLFLQIIKPLELGT